MLFLSTLKGITRDGSLETVAEVAHPGAGGDASEVCNRYQDVISSTPEGDALRARYAQVIFILDNQVRSQLEFPPPSAPEVAAASTGSGEGYLSGEGGALCPPIQQLSDYLAGLTVEQIAEQFPTVAFEPGAPKETMIEQVLATATLEREKERLHLQTRNDAELEADAIAAGITFPEGLSREERIEILLDGPAISELPHNTQAGTGEGNLAGAQATSDEPELPLGGQPAGAAKPADPPAGPPQGGETSPGSMSPARKRASSK